MSRDPYEIPLPYDSSQLPQVSNPYGHSTQDWLHYGVDFALSQVNALSVGTGYVVSVKNNVPPGTSGPGRLFGNYVTIYFEDPNHPDYRPNYEEDPGAIAEYGFYATYMHLNAVDSRVVKGARVELGDILGTVGNTGEVDGVTGIHLHFQTGFNLDPNLASGLIANATASWGAPPVVFQTTDGVISNPVGDASYGSTNHENPIDQVRSNVTYSMSADDLNLALTGDSNINATGNGSSNSIGGNAGSNSIFARGGNDFLTGQGGNDRLYGDAAPSVTAAEILAGPAGSDRLYGGAGNDRLDGNGGNDLLDGGIGVDTMTGSYGDDSYYVDDAADKTIEVNGQGLDTVVSSVSRTLGTGLEVLRLLGSAALNGVGNELSNRIVGNSGANQLHGLAGNDTIEGGGGSDTARAGTGNDSLSGGVGDDNLVGEAGNDTLVGGAGTDTAAGGAGDDTYEVDTAHDVIIESANNGYDTALSQVSLTLGNNLEALRLLGAGNSAGIGNAAANRIYGNAGANLLQGLAGNDRLEGAGGNDSVDGGAGVDTMLGGQGDDTYYVDIAGDTITELAGQGRDTVYSSVSRALGAELEILRLRGTGDINGYGNALANQIFGNAGANWLQGLAGNDALDGGAGNDLLDGGAGRDTLTGGAGNDTMNGGTEADVFRFANAGTGNDRIGGFSIAEDRFDLSGGSFSNALVIGNGTRLVHSGGTVFVAGVTGLTLAQWNARVLGASSSTGAEADNDGDDLDALSRPDLPLTPDLSAVLQDLAAAHPFSLVYGGPSAYLFT